MRTALWVVAVSGGVWLATGLAMRASIQGPSPWYGQWNHLWPGHEPFQGKILRGALDGIDVPNDSLERLPVPSDSFELVVELQRFSTHVPTLPVSVLRIVDGDQRVVLGLAQRGNDLVFEARLAGGSAGLRTPEWVFAGAMNIPVNEPWRLRWIWFPDRIEMTSSAMSGTGTQHVIISRTIGLGWVLMHPFVTRVGRSAELWTMLWLAGWFGLLGWFAGAAGDAMGAVFGVLGIGLFVSGSLLMSLPLRIPEVAVAATSCLLAAAISRFAQGHAMFTGKG